MRDQTRTIVDKRTCGSMSFMPGREGSDDDARVHGDQRV
jgi:hypothetical protein